MKLRLQEEINQEYTNHATHAGHKTATIAELEKEIEAHYKTMAKLRREPAKKTAPVEGTPTTETVSEATEEAPAVSA